MLSSTHFFFFSLFFFSGYLASISCSAGDHDTLKKQSGYIHELEKKKENSDLLITKLRSVVDVERKKVGDAKSELKCVVDMHTKDVGVIQTYVITNIYYFKN